MDELVSNRRDLNVDGARAKCFVLLNEAGITESSDRHDLASFVLGRRIRSWREFDESDWRRMLDSISGWHAIEHLRRERGL